MIKLNEIMKNKMNIEKLIQRIITLKNFFKNHHDTIINVNINKHSLFIEFKKQYLYRLTYNLDKNIVYLTYQNKSGYSNQDMKSSVFKIPENKQSILINLFKDIISNWKND